MTAPDVLCFSHLRWDFVFQRPNHLMSRCARDRQVLFIEEPMFDATAPWLEQTSLSDKLTRVVPHLTHGASEQEYTATIRDWLRAVCESRRIAMPLHWYYTPMMLPIGEGLPCGLTVYDCMDELSNFLHAPPALVARERELMRRADVVFTGGMALYEAKRSQHPHVHGIPSSVDVSFFQKARTAQPEPADQAHIARPRIGYCGVVDERIDIALLAGLAQARPELQLVLLGPVVKIDAAILPRAPNIHYLGAKRYEELPSYLAGWDVAMMPFALNEATRFISPTKTPEYLAAGREVVSTAIRDVVEPYERLGLVRIGRSPEDFIAQVDAALRGGTAASHAARDAFIASNSWDRTWERMARLIEEALATRSGHRHAAGDTDDGTMASSAGLHTRGGVHV